MAEIPMLLKIKHAFSIVRVLCIFLALSVSMWVFQTMQRFADRWKDGPDKK